MKTSRFNISLYLIIPVIISGLAVLSGIVSFQITEHYLKLDQELQLPLVLWLVLIGVVSFFLGLIIVSLLLKPVERFVEKAEKLPALTSMEKENIQYNRYGDKLEHFSMVFKQVTDVLTKVDARHFFPGIIGESRIIRGVLSRIIKAAPTDSTVFISGESGTGKELVAMSIYEHSNRNSKPFVKINCAAIPAELLESELFGHEKGAFTGAVSKKQGKFEIADGGTVFLDEIGDMPLNLQAKILRVLQEKEFDRVGGTHPVRVDVRFIVATNKNIEEMVNKGLFRDDLYHRLNVVALYLPPLRDRKDDIPLLIDYFIKQLQRPVQISVDSLKLLGEYSWPGNIRELQNTIESASVMCEGMIESRHLPAHITAEIRNGDQTKLNSQFVLSSIDQHMREMEKAIIMDALGKANGIQVKAAELLGINQRSLWHRIKKFNIDPSHYKSNKS